MKDTWYCRCGDTERGPISFDDVFELAKQGTLKPTDSVRSDEAAEWAAASTIVGLFPEEAAADGPEEIASLDDLNFDFVSDSQAAMPVPDTRPAAVEAPQEPDSSAADKWYYRKDEAELGPFGLEQLIQLAKAGAIGPDDWVRHGTDGAWLRGCKSPDLDGCFEDAPPPAPVAVETAPVEPESPPPAPPEPEAADADDPSDAPVAEKKKPKKKKRKPEPEPADDDDDELDLRDDEDEEPTPQLQSAASTSDRWFCRIEGVEHGPLTMSELMLMANHQRLSQTDTVREGDDGEWVSAGSMALLFAGAPKEKTPAASKFTAPAPAAAPKPRRSSGEPLFDRLAGNKIVIGALVAVVVAGLGVVAYSMFVPGADPAEFHDIYQDLDEIWTEHKTLRKQKAGDSQWEDLISRAEEVQAEVIPRLEGSSAKGTDELLAAVKDHLMPMLKTCRKSAGDAEKQFATKMASAQKLLGAPPPEYDTSAEEALPKEEKKEGGEADPDD